MNLPPKSSLLGLVVVFYVVAVVLNVFVARIDYGERA